MRYFFRYVGVTASLILLAQVALCQGDCVLKKENRDLKVFSCSSQNEKVNLIKTELILENTTFEELLTFLWDVENYVNWQYNAVEAAILKRTNDTSMIYRMVVEAPWPVSNREMVTQIVTNYDSLGRKLQITTRSIDYEYPTNNDLVRVPFSLGVWDVSLSGTSSLKIIYRLSIDPGGSVPPWLLNLAIAEGPYHSFSNLKEQLSGK